MNVNLTAVYLREDCRNWLDAAVGALRSRGLTVASHKSRCLVWDPKKLKKLTTSISYTDACQIGSIWVGGHRQAIGALPRRLYFDAAGEQIAAREWDILNGEARPHADVASSMLWIESIITGVQQADQDRFRQRIVLNSVETELDENASIVSQGTEFSVNTKLRQVFSQVGYDYVPAKMSILIIPDRRVSRSRTTSFIHSIKNSCEQHRLSVPIQSSSTDKLMARLKRLSAGSVVRTTETPVWFLLPRKNSPPSDEIWNLMEDLDSKNIRWRRAYADDDFQWSVSDQLGSVLQGAGGRTYSVAAQSCRLPWSIGVDISHGGQANLISTVCAALVDPTGNFVHAWSIRQKRNEAVSAVSVRKLLLSATDYVRSEAKNPDILVLRDGRLFERENETFYRDRLGANVTLVEIRKRQNPLLVDASTCRSPVSASCGAVPGTTKGTHVEFLLTHPGNQTRGFDMPLKIHWNDRWDGLNIGPRGLRKILVALTASPGLGLHARTLPAPIYWADGIAAVSGKELKFGGQAVTNII